MGEFIKSATKKSLLAFTKKGEITPRFWARFFEAFVTKDELQDFTSDGSVDHGTLSGLTHDDHTQYLLASAAGGRTQFASYWTDLTDTGDTTLHIHDSRYYTETELNAGQLDNRYYTETESDSRFLNVSGDTMTGYIGFPIATQTTATLTLGDSHYTVLCDGTSNTVTISLPTAVGITGRVYNIKAINIDNAVTVAPDGTEEIDGDNADIVLALMESITVQSDGSNWWII